MNDPWKPYIEAARAAGEPFAWVPDYGDSGAAWQRVEVPLEPPDSGRFEPTAYDLGITSEPGGMMRDLPPFVPELAADLTPEERAYILAQEQTQPPAPTLTEPEAGQ